MSDFISSGKRHTFTNEENGLALDLFESQDNSIIASPFHGAENQQVTTLAILITCPHATTITPSSGSQ
jgi:hypothetical protein